MTSGVLSVVAALGSLGLGGALLLRRRRSASHRRFFLTTIAVCAWLGGSGLARAATDTASALGLAAIALAGGATLPAAIHWLAAGFAPPRAGRQRLHLLGFALSLLFAGASLGGGIVRGVQPRAWGLQPSYGPLIWPLAVFGLAFWLAALREVRRTALSAELGRRAQARRLGVGLGAAGLAVVDLLPGLGLPVHPVGFVPLAFCVVMTARALGGESRTIPDEAARKILTTMADGLLVCDAAGRIELVNESLCALTGFGRERLLGLPMVSLFGGSGQDTFAGRRWKEQTVSEDLARLHGAAGELLDVSVSVSQLQSDEAELLGAVVLVRDIRETRQAQLRLAESEQRLAEAQRLARCGHWRWRAGAETVTGSEELFRIFGLSPAGSTLPWRHLFRRLARADRRALRRCVETALREANPFQLEARLVLPDGGERSIHLRGARVRDAEPPELLGTAQDVSERREAEKAMRALSKAVETTQVGITIADPAGQILYSNPADAELHGYAVSELVGADVGLLAPPELRRPLDVSALRTFQARRRETVNRHKDGRRFPVELTSDVLFDETGMPEAVVTSCLDITERKRTEARFRNLLESAPDPMVIADEKGIITLVNGRLEQELGYERQELLGQQVEVLVPESQRARISELRARSLAHPDRRPREGGVELRCRRKDGSEFPADVSLSPAQEPGGLLVIAAIRDISERKRLEEELVRRAFYDPVTGLPNRALLMERLESATARLRENGSPFAVLCVGLDRLDALISSLGPETADEVLVATAERLRAYALAGDTVAAIERGLFVVLVERLSAVADATRLADRILSDLSQKTRVSGRDIFTGASVGVALAGSTYEKADAILRDAETALHRARARRGPGSYEVFDEAMRERATLRLELGSELRWALERGELFLEYQPIVSVATGRIRGAEALLRWRHPQRGLLPPSTLIPLAEETGMILPIGEWALGAACRQSLEWQEAGLDPVFVAVNLSATQFRQRELPAVVRGVLRDVGLDPRRLELELTETVLVDDVELAIDALGALGETGVGLCIDDFGVGHSSLSYLQRFPMSTLKIDGSFIRDLGEAERADSMLASIIGLAHNLGLKAIAEGVECERQLAALRAQTCDEFQGHYFSPSVPNDEFTRLVLEGSSPGPLGVA